jgi:hypothetical protein
MYTVPMTRKEYVATAQVIKAQVQKADTAKDITAFFVASEIAKGMAGIFASDNPAFSEKTFFSACGL